MHRESSFTRKTAAKAGITKATMKEFDNASKGKKLPAKLKSAIKKKGITKNVK